MVVCRGRGRRTFASSGRVRDPVVTGMHGRHMSARPCRALLPCDCAKLGWQTRLLAQRRSRTAPLPKPMWMVYSATVLPSCLSCSDVLFCHRPDPDTPIEETVRAMNWVLNQVRCGVVWCMGVVKANTVSPIGFLQCPNGVKCRLGVSTA